MKRFATILAAFAVAGIASAHVAVADPVSFQVDRAHSDVGFDVRHFFNKVHGKFTDYDGSIVYDAKNLTVSTVSVVIRDSSINTNNERRDAHLRTQDFFWQEKYPTITFKSTKVIPGKDDNHFQVIGDLTIRGVTKSVTLDTEFLGMGSAMIGGNDFGTQAGFLATLTIPDRKEYGLIWNKTLDQGGTMLGDDVAITLNIAAVSHSTPAAGAAKK